ncbi:hypothetical protein JXB31_02925 [Candidatus Woesearchaeota archaeon]|nr:hypothetical protein [Candidatus Woesearchaeota archaeon]
MQYRLKKLLGFLENKRIMYLVLIALCCSVLLVPQVVRFAFHGNLPIGSESYKDAVIAGEVINRVFPGTWSDSLPSCKGVAGPHHVLLAIFAYIMGIEFSMKLIPFLCGILTFYLLYRFTENRIVDNEMPSLFLLLLFSSPLFIYAFTVFNPFSLAIPLALAGLLLVGKGRFGLIAALVLFGLMPFFGIDIMVTTALSLLVMALFSPKRKPYIYMFSSCAFFGVAYVLALVSLGSFSVEHSFHYQNLFQENLVLFGAIIGFSVFMLILAGVGIVSVWKMKKRYYGIYCIMLLLLIYSLFINPLLKIPLTMFVSYFAFLGLVRLINMVWELKIIANLTLLTITIGLLFTPISYAINLVGSEPHEDMAAALSWLRQNSGSDEIVFSDYRNAYWIEYFSQRPALLNPGNVIGEQDNTPSALFNDSLTLMKTRDYEESLEIMRRYSIRYILLDKKMETYLYENNVAGLPFLLESTETFKNVYSSSRISIWEVNLTSAEAIYET